MGIGPNAINHLIIIIIIFTQAIPSKNHNMNFSVQVLYQQIEISVCPDKDDTGRGGGGINNWLDKLAHIIIERSLSIKFSTASPTLGVSSLSRARTKGSLGPA